jgi:glucose/arabinose dehydrogenase
MGLRNPFGIGCDPLTGNPLVADNGERGFDQVRLAEPGSNHGWPVSRQRDEIVAPWFDSRAASVAPTAITTRPDHPNLVLVSAFQSRALYELTIDRDRSETTAIRLLADVDGGAYAVATGPDGCIYFTDVAAVWRLQEPGCE